MKTKNIFPKVTEAEIKRDVCNYLQILENGKKLYYIRTNSGAVKLQNGAFMRNGKAGCPDIIVLCGGMFIGFELKVGKNKQSESQIEAEKRIKQCGGEYYIVRDLNEIIKILYGKS